MNAEMNANSAKEFLALRPRLFAVAYRMMGTVSDSEDIVQDCFIRWQNNPRSGVKDQTGYLIRMVTNLSIDRLRSVQKQRSNYPGEWLPEPIFTEDLSERTDHDVSVALLLVLERLTPLERAAFLLRDVFDTDYDQIAGVLQRSPATCRKLVTRARAHVHEARPRTAVNPEDGRAITQAFFQATRTGDTDALSKLLAEDAQMISDGGGKVVAARRIIFGREKLTRFFQGIARKSVSPRTKNWRLCSINGLPAILSCEGDGDFIQTTSLDIRGRQIERIYIVRNPDKTAHLARHLPEDA